ncbi:winged helix-turn-helix domain-containing protein [Streptomyces sp. Je 1-79]|uniref:GntR family transcriptional regulator n=1 Tax=Streptomyces sp. Je 1-79 TaxID=2943847 RepID=UPI0021A4FB3C|nr:winged helix-turn-helix domain-containing protein [Streptomyces sp. Je 1-79]MCT4355871.1 winged helix-turn-helix domain-containing protein [Streptomyces sp. Je 1-79]
MSHQASPRGTYLVVAEALRQHLQGSATGSALPSEAELMLTHKVSRNTIRRALKTLEADGMVEPVPGVGWRMAGAREQRSLLELLTAVISEDSLAVGDTFPSEATLCQRFHTSRTAVRRALAQMEGMGLLDTVHGRGRTVRALPASPA